MELKDYLAIMWRRKWIVITIVIVTILMIGVGTYLTPPTYSTSAKLRVVTVLGNSSRYPDTAYIERLLNTYTRMATSKPSLDQLKSKLGLAELPRIEVAALPNTEIIQITVDDKNPVEAVLVANTLSNILVGQSSGFYSGNGKDLLHILNNNLTQAQNDLDKSRKDYDSLVSTMTNSSTNSMLLDNAKRTVDLKQQIYANLLDQYIQTRIQEEQWANTVSVLEPASLPDSPAKPNKPLNFALGLVVSLVVGLGLAFLLENLDSTLVTTDQIEAAAEKRLIGKIPKARYKAENVLPLVHKSLYQEAFLQLKTNILTANPERPVRSLLVTSTGKDEGKSSIASGLAYVLALSGKKVAIVDINLRLRRLHTVFCTANQMGLSDYLNAAVDLENVIQKTSTRGIHIIPSGPLPENPVQLLNSPRMRHLIHQLTQAYDLVLLDAPPVLGVADVSVVASEIDAVLFVAKIKAVQKEPLQSALMQLANVHVRSIFLVVNQGKSGRLIYHQKKERQVTQTAF